jgi:hypothetical protein
LTDDTIASRQIIAACQEFNILEVQVVHDEIIRDADREQGFSVRSLGR